MRASRADVVYYGALAVSFALGMATLWCVDYLPTNDGPQHIFLGHAENLYSEPNAVYGRQLIPQLQFAGRGFALWWNPLEPLLGFRDATRVVLSLFYSWSFAGYVLLVHALGKSRRWLALLGPGVVLVLGSLHGPSSVLRRGSESAFCSCWPTSPVAPPSIDAPRLS